MKTPFIERNIFIKHDGGLEKVRIVIEKPLPVDDVFFSCKILFLNVKKYNCSAKGIDEFHALECAFAYINGICMNSEDPEFYFTETESMKGFDHRA